MERPRATRWRVSHSVTSAMITAPAVMNNTVSYRLTTGGRWRMMQRNTMPKINTAVAPRVAPQVNLRSQP